MQQLAYESEQGFLWWSVPRGYKEDNGATKLVVSACEERTWGREAEESPLLEAVAMERLVKTQEAGKGSAGGVVICELWRLAMAL
jgi:hypothetical protein